MRTLFFFAMSAALTCVLSAQEKRSIKLRTLCFQHVDGISEVLLATGGKPLKTTPVKLFASTFSDEVEAPIEGNTIRFVISSKGPGGEETLRTVAKGKAVGGKRQLAVFIPGKGDFPYDLIMLDDSEKSFPMGSTLALNLSSTAIRLKIGERRIQLKPGGRKVSRAPRKLNDRNQANILVSFMSNDRQWVEVSNTRWQISPLTRNLVIGFIHPITGQPTVNSYAETPPWRRPQLP